MINIDKFNDEEGKEKSYCSKPLQRRNGVKVTEPANYTAFCFIPMSLPVPHSEGGT